VPTEDEDLVAKGDAVVGDSARGALTAEEEDGFSTMVLYVSYHQ